MAAMLQQVAAVCAVNAVSDLEERRWILEYNREVAQLECFCSVRGKAALDKICRTRLLDRGLGMERFSPPEGPKGKRVQRVPGTIVQEVANLAQQAYQDPKRLNRTISVATEKDCQKYLVASLEARGYAVLLEEGIREAFADYRGPQKRSIMMLDRKVCVDLRMFVGHPKAPHILQLKNQMVVTKCECGMVICFPNDGSNSIDARWVTFERGRFKTNELLWTEDFICPDIDVETIPARPSTSTGRRVGGAYESSRPLRLPETEESKAGPQRKDISAPAKAAKSARAFSKEEALQDEIKTLRGQNTQMLEDQKQLASQMQQLQQKFMEHMDASAAQLDALQTQLFEQSKSAVSSPISSPLATSSVEPEQPSTPPAFTSSAAAGAASDATDTSLALGEMSHQQTLSLKDRASEDNVTSFMKKPAPEEGASQVESAGEGAESEAELAGKQAVNVESSHSAADSMRPTENGNSPAKANVNTSELYDAGSGKAVLCDDNIVKDTATTADSKSQTTADGKSSAEEISDDAPDVTTDEGKDTAAENSTDQTESSEGLAEKADSNAELESANV
ncbi:hypothetical protein WJX84_000382 [Apatococcus fuscideae]